MHDLPRHVELARGLDDQAVELVGRRVPEQVEHVAAEERAREAHAELAQSVQSVPRAVVAIADVAEFVADAADAPVGARDERRLVDEAGLAFPCVAGHRDPDAQRRVGAHDGLVDADAREDDELGVGLDHVGGHLGGQRLGRLARRDDLGRDPQGGEREVGVLPHDERHLAVAGQRSDEPEAVLVDPVGRARQSRHDGGGLIADEAEAPQRDRHGQVALGVDPDRLRGAAGAGGCLEPTSAQPEAHLELGVDDDAARHLGVDVREGEVGGLLACPAHARRIAGAELRAGAEAAAGDRGGERGRRGRVKARARPEARATGAAARGRRRWCRARHRRRSRIGAGRRPDRRSRLGRFGAARLLDLLGRAGLEVRSGGLVLQGELLGLGLGRALDHHHQRTLRTEPEGQRHLERIPIVARRAERAQQVAQPHEDHDASWVDVVRERQDQHGRVAGGADEIGSHEFAARGRRRPCRHPWCRARAPRRAQRGWRVRASWPEPPRAASAFSHARGDHGRLPLECHRRPRS